MISVKEAASTLGISPTRVRKLISDGVLPAQKYGNSWMIEESVVLSRLSNHPKAGRPRKCFDGNVASPLGKLKHNAQRSDKAHKLYLECKELLATIPDSALIASAESAEEASFYIATSDFFLQQKQRELIKQGVF